MISAERHVRPDLCLEATLVGRDAQGALAPWTARHDRAQLGSGDSEAWDVDAVTIETLEDDILQGDGRCRVELVSKTPLPQVELTRDQAIAGEAGELDLHAASIGRR